MSLGFITTVDSTAKVIQLSVLVLDSIDVKSCDHYSLMIIISCILKVNRQCMYNVCIVKFYNVVQLKLMQDAFLQDGT